MLRLESLRRSHADTGSSSTDVYDLLSQLCPFSITSRLCFPSCALGSPQTSTVSEMFLALHDQLTYLEEAVTRAERAKRDELKQRY